MTLRIGLSARPSWLYYLSLWVRHGFNQGPPFIHLILAMGVQMDLDRPPYDPIAETYHQLCRASLALTSIETVTMNGIRAVHCLCYYLQSTDKKDAIFECSIFQGLLVKMAQSVSNPAARHVKINSCFVPQIGLRE